MLPVHPPTDSEEDDPELLLHVPFDGAVKLTGGRAPLAPLLLQPLLLLPLAPRAAAAVTFILQAPTPRPLCLCLQASQSWEDSMARRQPN